MKFKIIKFKRLDNSTYYQVKYKPHWFTPFMTVRLGPHEHKDFDSYTEAKQAIEIVKGWYTKEKSVVVYKE